MIDYENLSFHELPGTVKHIGEGSNAVPRMTIAAQYLSTLEVCNHIKELTSAIKAHSDSTDKASAHLWWLNLFLVLATVVLATHAIHQIFF